MCGATTPDAEKCVFLAAITVSELLHGVHRAADLGRRARRTIIVEEVVDRFPIVNLDLPTARVHAELWAFLASEGKLFGAHDLWLAVSALSTISPL